MRDDRSWTEVTTGPLSEGAIASYVATPASGGVVVFSGIVRDHHEGRAVVAIEYTAVESLAAAKLRDIALEVLDDAAVHRVAAVHRIGHLEVGEASVMVAASAAHRADAFRAAQRLIDRIKEVVPVWKHEHFADGTKSWAPGFTPSVADRRPGVGEEVR